MIRPRTCGADGQSEERLRGGRRLDQNGTDSGNELSVDGGG